MIEPPIGTLGTTWTSPRMGDPLSVLLDVVRYRADDAANRIEQLIRRHGHLARTNLALTGRKIWEWDIDRIARVEVL